MVPKNLFDTFGARAQWDGSSIQISSVAHPRAPEREHLLLNPDS